MTDNQVAKTRTMTQVMRDDGMIYGVALPDFTAVGPQPLYR